MGAVMNIPPEALEAGARVLHANLELFEDLPWEDLSDADQDEYREQIRAACLAMLTAWPGMRLGKYRDVAGDNDRIILPLAAPSGALKERT